VIRAYGRHRQPNFKVVGTTKEQAAIDSKPAVGNADRPIPEVEKISGRAFAGPVLEGTPIATSLVGFLKQAARRVRNVIHR